MSVSKTQIAVVSGAIILIVLLLFANTTPPPAKEEAKVSEHAGPNTIELTKLIQNSIAGLTTVQKQTIQKMDEATKSSADKKAAFETIINELDTLRLPAVAAFYMEKAAEASPIEKNWTEAGNR